MNEAITNPRRLLIVEDSAHDRTVFRRDLSRFVLEFAHTGEEALKILSSESFDLILLDLNLPGISGREVLSAIREELHLDVPVVIVTNLASESAATDLLRQGATGYATKDDLNTPRLIASVYAALGRHRIERARAEVEAKSRSRTDTLEAVLRQTLEDQGQLVQSEKMASLGQLAAGIAHEINNPLAWVLNNLVVLERDVRHVAALNDLYRAQLGENISNEILEAEQLIDLPFTVANLSRLLKSSQQGLIRVREIVSSLRDFARLDEAECKEIDPNDIVRDTVEMVSYSLLEKRIELEIHLAELPILCCNPGKLNQVIINILLNAIQAVDNDALITIRSMLDEELQEIRFEIADTGPGIPEMVRGRIFDPFFTTKPQGVGTGLGLWAAYNIVKEHSGRIEVETEPGKGTTFSIVLPLDPKREKGPDRLAEV